MDLEPGQTCADCNKVIGEESYSIYYNKDCEVTKIVCTPCVKNEMIDDYNKTKYISTKLMMEASIAKYYIEEADWTRLREESAVFFIKNKKVLMEVANAVEDAKKLIHEFEDKHWIPYIRKYWKDTTSRGHITEIGDIKVMMWGCAGRVMITAENKEGSVTMIFSDEVQSADSIEWGRTRGGIQGFSTTADNALQMLKSLVQSDKIEFRVDDEVTMLGV